MTPEMPPPQPRPQPPYGRPSRPGRLTPWIVLGVVLALGGCMLFGFMSLVGAALPSAGSVSSSGNLIEKTVSGSGSDKIALIEITGVIARSQGGGLFGGGGGDLVERLNAEFDQAGDDPSVKGVLLSIDSPGGTVTASDQIWHRIQTFRQKTNKPVVVHMGAVCASGGVYVAVSGDKIVCEPTTITGSIGVVLSTLNFAGLIKEYGVQDVTITSGPNKDLLNSTAPVREEHLEILRGMVMNSYDRFTQLVADGRNIPVEEVRGFADGRIYTPDQALDLKLIDKIGYREDALAECEKLAGITSSKLVRYGRPPTLADVLAGTAKAPAGLQLNIDAGLLDRLGAPRLLVLWQPNH